MKTATALLLAAISCARAAPNCDEYTKKGYCLEDKFKSYMNKHCPGACDAPAAAQEDEACGNWAAEGYCTHPQFVSRCRSHHALRIAPSCCARAFG